MPKVRELKKFIAEHGSLASVEIDSTQGSTPREAGTVMLVSSTSSYGTIGGGRLEFLAIDYARLLLSGHLEKPSIEIGKLEDQGDLGTTLSIPLGPTIGQCCGGNVKLRIRCVNPDIAREILEKAEAEEADFPNIYIFGGGHVGKALATALSPLPFQVSIIDTRSDVLIDLPDTVAKQIIAIPEQVVRKAPPDSAFLVMTHDHALDFVIAAEALKRNDSTYVGLIGSQTKKAAFKTWFLKRARGNADQLSHLVCPIGGKTKDKQPSIIAALAAAQILRRFSCRCGR